MFCSMVVLSICHFSKPACFLKTSWCTCKLVLCFDFCLKMEGRVKVIYDI